MRITKIYILPALWVAVVFIFSSSSFSGKETFDYIKWLTGVAGLDFSPAALDSFNFIIRKTAHVVTYAVLALLWFRAFINGHGMGRALSFLLALAVSILVATLDEYNQSLVIERTSSPADVLIDTAGALAALVLVNVYLLKKRAATPTQS